MRKPFEVIVPLRTDGIPPGLDKLPRGSQRSYRWDKLQNETVGAAIHGHTAEQAVGAET